MNRTHDQSKRRSRSVRLAAVGDVLLATPPENRPDGSPLQRLADAGRLLAGADIALANLECTLPADGPTVPSEPRVVSRPEWIARLGQAGVSLVSLANNHVFDCLDAGFGNLRQAVRQAGMAPFGAGDTLGEAVAPLMVERNGLRLAFLAAVDPRTGPSAQAAPDRAGVAPLDVDRLTGQVRDVSGRADHVIVSLHWGEERFALPSPGQIAWAHALVDAGASAVLGHHPHVLQGLEVYRGAPIAYSLGNFLATRVYWSNGDVLRWSRRERTGCVLWIDFGPEGVLDVQQQATFDDGRSLRRLDTGRARRRLERLNRRVARGVSTRRYRRERLWVHTVRPVLGHLRWSRLRRLSWRNVRNAFQSVRRALAAR